MSHGNNKNRIKVKIYGEHYTMKSTAPPDYMKRIANYVDEKMQQVSDTNDRLGLNKVAVLTALNVADELFKVRRELHELETRLKKKNMR